MVASEDHTTTFLRSAFCQHVTMYHLDSLPAHHLRKETVGSVLHPSLLPQFDIEGFPHQGLRCAPSLQRKATPGESQERKEGQTMLAHIIRYIAPVPTKPTNFHDNGGL